MAATDETTLSAALNALTGKVVELSVEMRQMRAQLGEHSGFQDRITRLEAKVEFMAQQTKERGDGTRWATGTVVAIAGLIATWVMIGFYVLTHVQIAK